MFLFKESNVLWCNFTHSCFGSFPNIQIFYHSQKNKYSNVLCSSSNIQIFDQSKKGSNVYFSKCLNVSCISQNIEIYVSKYWNIWSFKKEHICCHPYFKPNQVMRTSPKIQMFCVPPQTLIYLIIWVYLWPPMFPTTSINMYLSKCSVWGKEYRMLLLQFVICILWLIIGSSFMLDHFTHK